jgi:hypothetical protein
MIILRLILLKDSRLRRICGNCVEILEKASIRKRWEKELVLSEDDRFIIIFLFSKISYNLSKSIKLVVKLSCF